MSSSPPSTAQRQICRYCSLVFRGPGYAAPDGHAYCCYGCYLIQRIVGESTESAPSAWILARLGVGAFLAMNVMMVSLVLYTVSERDLGANTVAVLRWLMLGASTPAMLVLGGPFVGNAVREIATRRCSTDSLVAMGSFAAYGVSAYSVVSGRGQVYFDTATMLLTLVTVGRFLEASTRSRTSRSVRELLEAEPGGTHVLRDGQEVDVPAADVRVGDLVVVRPGERIPADGVVTSGSSLVEEAAFSGEPRPRPCSSGDRVYGGSLSCDGRLVVRAEAVGSDALLARVLQMVDEAQSSRAPVELLVDRIARIFTPAVWVLAACSLGYWGVVAHNVPKGAMAALAVLVVACPCALGLATPLATCLAIGRCARAGVLVRSGEVLEQLPRVERLFVDKTGTLTRGTMSVARIVCAEADDEAANRALALLATLESGSEHAIARAVVAEARAREIGLGELSEFRAVPGRGAAGRVALGGRSTTVMAGSSGFMREVGLAIPPALAIDGADTVTYGAWDGMVRAAVVLEDEARPEARSAVGMLAGQGIRVAMLSGDRRDVAEKLARQVGISDVRAECSPEAKVAAVRQAADVGEVVAMVGDGVNDAPALAAAHVGMAMAAGTDLARQSSGVTLLGDELTRIPWLFDLARATYRTIRRNLAWAFGYNMVALTAACLGMLHPLLAALLMLFSSVAVSGSSLRLLHEPKGP